MRSDLAAMPRSTGHEVPEADTPGTSCAVYTYLAVKLPDGNGLAVVWMQ